MLIKKQKIPFVKMLLIGILPSFVKKAVYRLKGFEIGKGVKIGIGSVIIGKQVKIADGVKIGLASVVRAEEIQIDRFVTIGSFTFIDTGKLVIGEDARINEQVIIGGMKRPESALTLGARTIIMEYSFINTTCAVSIGDDSGIGGHCLLFTHGSWLNQLEGFPVNFAPIHIGKSVWLPWRVFVMPGVSIGDQVVIGANSLISKSIASHSLVAGSPAKVLRTEYPKELNTVEKEKLFRESISDFIRHLEHHQVAFECKQNETEIKITSKAQPPFQMIFCFGKLQLNKYSDNKDTVLVYNITTTNDESPLPVQHAMLLDITNKTRKGTSAAGEELVKFLGRYGLRLKRLD